MIPKGDMDRLYWPEGRGMLKFYVGWGRKAVRPYHE